jgi:hypothetical protein
VKSDSRYSDNWVEISNQVKAAANYRCELCGRYGVQMSSRAETYAKAEKVTE